MADVAVNLETATAKELAGKGIRAYILQDYDSAVRALSKASEMLVAQHGSETHDALGDVYLYYGKALLDLSRKEGDPLVGGALKTVQEESDEDDGGEDEQKTENEAVTNGEEKSEPEEAKPAGDEEPTETIEEASTTTTAEAKPSETKDGEEAEEELTDLQVAWEVLELAKGIFKERGESGKKNLAETLVVLGEISLESGNFVPAIEDMLEGLEMQKSLFKNDNRTVAETLFKLGGAYSTNGQIDEAIDSFNSSYQSLKNIAESMEKDVEHKQENADELEELQALIPEIEEKIADMKNLKLELSRKKENGAEEAAPKTNGQADASSSKKINDISHLVKRKRKEDEPEEENPAKKPSP